MLETGYSEDAIMAGGKYWIANDKAENIKNLPQGYYEQQLGGKELDWLRCYVGGQYVYVKKAKQYGKSLTLQAMVVDAIEVDKNLPIQIGLDFGLPPAAVFGQRYSSGKWHILYEIVSEDMGLERFAQMLLYELNTRFDKLEPMIWGDPAGSARDQIFEVTSFDHLRSLGLNARPTASNDFKVRRTAGASPMTRLVEGKAALQIDARCRRLIKSLAGGYHFKK